MLTPLARAPIGLPLILRRVASRDLAARVARLGLFENSRLTRLNDTVAIGPAKVRGPRGDVTLGGWLAAKLVIHTDDDRRLPLLECAQGDSGHVEGITGQAMVEESLAALGLEENDRITFLRRLPPMLYTATVDGRERVRLSEGLAAKILGDTQNGPAQFCAVGVGEPFTVRRILAGEHAGETLRALGIRPGLPLALVSVAAGQVVGSTRKTPVACATHDGLRLYFQEKDANLLLVEPEMPEAGEG